MAFNSRPHKEVDFIDFCGEDGTIELSIHDLTRRSTTIRQQFWTWRSLSIHDLTRRSTRREVVKWKGRKPFNSRPHKEVDDTRPRSNRSVLVFQFTTSQGGRLLLSCTFVTSVIFQFTTSQGGRPEAFAIVKEGEESFNSRPHKEVDSKYPQISRIFV